MTTKRDTERLDKKRAAVVAKILEIAPHADLLIGMLDEIKIDLLLIALTGAQLPADDPDEASDATA